jgi:hypothetical protein
MLMATIRARIVPVVFACEHCGKYHHTAVRIVGDGAIVSLLPERCTCAEPLNTAERHAHVQNTARLLVNVPLGVLS